ncbi:uncharacterized protein LOC130718209 [Lotus japonicus]|uniref:uncharacterized protein LOC130718209 n=1 Tax=Lotus japonicus TaxID=34305 RepID=UPI00258E2907|nr:uncharacterized protein LOC130718209 [Lotus japonicus]
MHHSASQQQARMAPKKVSLAFALKTLFIILGVDMLVILLFTVIGDGHPFRKEIFTPWMVATSVDLYINFVALCVWIAYRESNWISSLLWIISVVFLGGIATCAYIVLQFMKLTSSQASSEDLIYYVLLRTPHKNDTRTKRKTFFVVMLRILFSILGVVMLGTLVYTLVTAGSPFRMEIFTPWMSATLIDFYVNVVALAVWVTYKEPSWICAVFWIILLICFGSIATCTYIVWKLLQIQDPAYLVLVRQAVKVTCKPEAPVCFDCLTYKFGLSWRILFIDDCTYLFNNNNVNVVIIALILKTIFIMKIII